MIRRTLFILCSIILGAYPLAAQAEMGPNTELARVDDDPITYLDLVRLAKSSYALKAQPQTDQAVIRKLIDDLVFDAVARKEALKVDLSRNWRYQNHLRKTLTLVGIQMYYDEVMAPKIQFDSSSIDSFYRAHIDRYTVPVKQRLVQQITVYKPGRGIPAGYLTPLDTLYQGWDPKRKVDSLYTRLKNGEDFGHLAVLYSEEPRARTTAGSWGWVSETGIADTTLAPLIFDQPLHRVSKPIELGYGWMIIHVMDEREAGATPMDATVMEDIREQLTLQLGKRLARQLTDSIASQAQLDYVDRVMSFPDSELTYDMPMAIVNHADTIRAADYLLYKTAREALRGNPNLSPAQRRDVIVSIARSVALYQALRQWGYLDRPEVKEVAHRERIQGGVDEIMTDVMKTHDPTPAEVEKYYNEHIREYTPEKRHFIQYRLFAEADSATNLADNWRAGKVPDWADSRWVGPDDVPNTVWNRIAGVPPGTIIGPLHVGSEYWVISLERIAKPKALGEMRASIIAHLRNQETQNARDRWLRSVTANHTIVRYRERIAQVVLPTVVAGDEMLKSAPSPESIENATLLDE